MAILSPRNLRPLGTMVAYGFEKGSVTTDLDIAERLGATYLEILPDWKRFPDPIAMKRLAEDRGLTIWSAHGCWGGQSIRASRVDLASVNPTTWTESVDDLRRCCRWLADAGGRCLIVHPGGLSEPSESEARRESLVRGLDRLAGEVTKSGMGICVENMPPGVHPGSQMTELAAIVTELDCTEVALALDTGHAHLGRGIEGETLAADECLLRTTHVHDNNGRSDSHLPPGKGTLHWAAFTSAMNALKYQGPIMLECIRELRKRPERIDAAFLELLHSLR